MEPENPLRERINSVVDMDARLWMLISSLIIIEFYRRRLEQITRLDKAILIQYQREAIRCLQRYLCRPLRSCRLWGWWLDSRGGWVGAIKTRQVIESYSRKFP